MPDKLIRLHYTVYSDLQLIVSDSDTRIRSNAIGSRPRNFINAVSVTVTGLLGLIRVYFI